VCSSSLTVFADRRYLSARLRSTRPWGSNFESPFSVRRNLLRVPVILGNPFLHKTESKSYDLQLCSALVPAQLSMTFTPTPQPWNATHPTISVAMSRRASQDHAGLPQAMMDPWTGTTFETATCARSLVPAVYRSMICAKEITAIPHRISTALHKGSRGSPICHLRSWVSSVGSRLTYVMVINYGVIPKSPVSRLALLCRSGDKSIKPDQVSSSTPTR
jgi:hypothetical protein